MASTQGKLLPNPNHMPESTIPRVRLGQAKLKAQPDNIWTGETRAGRNPGERPRKSRVDKEAQYRTGAQRFFERHSGTGRPLNEPPKKGGAGGHNWGWSGMEVGVALASKKQLRDIDRISNPVAPTNDEEPWEEEEQIIHEGEEEWEEEEEEEWEEEGVEHPVSWEWHIAGGRNTRTPGYWIGLDCVRTLFGEPAPEDSQDAELPHANFLSFVSGVVREYIFGDRTTEGREGERNLALKLGGPPKNYRNIIWGDKESEEAFYQGVPVIPWGEEESFSEHVNTTTAPLSGTKGGKLTEQDPEETKRMMEAKKEEVLKRFINRGYAIASDFGAPRQGRRSSAVENELEIEKMESEGGRAGGYVGESAVS